MLNRSGLKNLGPEKLGPERLGPERQAITNLQENDAGSAPAYNPPLSTPS